MLEAGRDPPPRGQATQRSRAHQTAGVWVVVNHPEMSLFRGLNEAPTTKGGPACGRTACPPAPDTHNGFIQEPCLRTKAQKSIRPPATPHNARIFSEPTVPTTRGLHSGGDETGTGETTKNPHNTVGQRGLGGRHWGLGCGWRCGAGASGRDHICCPSPCEGPGGHKEIPAGGSGGSGGREAACLPTSRAPRACSCPFLLPNPVISRRTAGGDAGGSRRVGDPLGSAAGASPRAPRSPADRVSGATASSRSRPELGHRNRGHRVGWTSVGAPP